MKNLIARYIEKVLACPARGPLETLFGGILRGPLATLTASGAKQFAGRTTINSGTAFVTISTQMVNSDSIILHGFAVQTTVASGSGGPATCVSSIVSGVSFALGYTDGVQRGPGGTFMWELRRTS
jgi:hypothetical protein